MGGEGYVPGTARQHRLNLWQPITEAITRVEGSRDCDYTNWSKKRDATAAETVTYVCRDTLQWMALWCGERYADRPVGAHYIAFSTVTDDICVPPLDLIGGRFRIYGRSLPDMVTALDRHGWGADATHMLLSLTRQYILQYTEKADFDPTAGRSRLEAELNRAAEVWDSVVYHLLTANTYGGAIVVGRTHHIGPARFDWHMDASICDCVSMNLGKSAQGIYQVDDFSPTDHDSLRTQRETGYHSVYLDLIDDLVHGGAPEPLVNYGRSGLLFVPLGDRYRERRAGHRFPIRPAMARELRRLFGARPTDDYLDGRFHRRVVTDA
jgi:hypothetical protein